MEKDIKTTLISVVVPVFNTYLFLDRCIFSILAQTHKNLEILLIDDGSTDDSLQKCNAFKKMDKRIKVFHKKNGGLSSARNLGLQNATGEYICFVDSDDYVENNYIELLLTTIISKNTDVAVCSFFEDNANVPEIEFQEEVIKGDQFFCR